MSAPSSSNRSSSGANGHDVTEYRVRRMFNGKSGIHGTDYVDLGAKLSLSEALARAANHLSVADEVAVEARVVSPWEEIHRG